MKNVSSLTAFILLTTLTLTLSLKYSYTTYNNGNKTNQPTSFNSLTLKLYNKSKEYIFNLVKNRLFLSKDYREVLVDGKKLQNEPVVKESQGCYYDNVKDKNDESFAAVNFCDNLDGVVRIEGKYHELKGISHDQVEVSISGDTGLKTACGVESHNQNDSNFLFRRKRDFPQGYYQDFIDEDIRIVEIYIVIDYPVFYEEYGMNRKKAFRDTKEYVHVSNKLFQKLELFVVLVGVEIWEKPMYSLPEQSARDILNVLTIARYETLFFLPRHDAMLFNIAEGNNDALGFAFVGTLCSPIFSNLWYNKIKGDTLKTGILITHELLHLFSVKHNNASCKCPFNTECIMNEKINKASQEFSQCTKDTLKDTFKNNRDFCLHNLVEYSEVESVCGNGFLEEGEECDCGGRSKKKCNSDCCDSSSCKLKGKGSQCASGLCCDIQRCKLKKIGFVCRPSTGECDLDDVCDGVTNFCPSSNFKPNGEICSEDSYCYQGKCMHPDINCEFTYGKGAKNSGEKCYDYNTFQTNSTGCHRKRVGDEDVITPCADEDKFCGVSFCDVDVEMIRSLLSQPFMDLLGKFSSIIGADFSMNERCYKINMPTSDENFDPTFVFNGRKCGENKMCYQRKCVHKDSVKELRRQERGFFARSGCGSFFVYTLTNYIFIVGPLIWMLEFGR